MAKSTPQFESEGGIDSLDRRLISLYLRFATPVDALAYSDTFEQMYLEMQREGDDRSKGDVFRRLLTLRKAGLLPRLDPRISGGSDAKSA